MKGGKNKMEYNKIDLKKLKEEFPQYRFKSGFTINVTERERQLGRTCHVLPEYIAPIQGPAIAVNRPRRFYGLLSGEPIAVAYRRDKIKKFSPREYEKFWVEANFEIEVKSAYPDARLERRLKETLEGDFENVRKKLEAEGGELLESLSQIH